MFTIGTASTTNSIATPQRINPIRSYRSCPHIINTSRATSTIINTANTVNQRQLPRRTRSTASRRSTSPCPLTQTRPIKIPIPATAIRHRRPIITVTQLRRRRQIANTSQISTPAAPPGNNRSITLSGNTRPAFITSSIYVHTIRITFTFIYPRIITTS